MMARVFIIILFILNLVGIWGFLNPEWQQLFAKLTPINLLISTFIILFTQEKKNGKFYLFCVLIFSLGLLVEILGVQTGLIFGNYHYGSVLGWKLMNTPVMIGVVWLLCTLSVTSLMAFLSFAKWIKVLLGASLLVFLDHFIEPVAIALNFWSWENGYIPIQNFIAWWLISAVFLSIYYLLKLESKNTVAAFHYFILLFFFGTLCLLL